MKKNKDSLRGTMFSFICPFNISKKRRPCKHLLHFVLKEEYKRYFSMELTVEKYLNYSTLTKTFKSIKSGRNS